MLVKIFEEIVQKCLFVEFFEFQLREYMLRFADKIIQISRGDLLINATFFSSLLTNILTSRQQEAMLSIRDNENSLT